MDYIDTSVLASYYCPEARSARVQRILSGVRNPTLSPLVEVELYCALSQKVRAGDLDATTARRIAARFQVDLAQPRYRIASVHAAVYRVAGQWAEQMAQPLRALDTLHLAVAFTHDLRLLTADRIMARCAKSLGVKHRLLV